MTLFGMYEKCSVLNFTIFIFINDESSKNNAEFVEIAQVNDRVRT